MLKRLARRAGTSLLLALIVSVTAQAQPSCNRCGTWEPVELYSNADGSVQFVMLQSTLYVSGASVAQQLAGQTLIASDGATEHSIPFTRELPDVTTRPFLIGTQGFADLKLVQPDFIMPSGFLFLTNASLRLRDSSWSDRDVLHYQALPTDGSTALYMDIDGDYFYLARATNNAGQSYTFTPNAPNSFRMTAIFSDQAGFYQYIQLREASGLDSQHHFTGLTLEVTSRNGRFKSFVFPHDLPDSHTAGQPVLIGTAHVGPPDIDFALPPDFLPTDGATLVFAGVDIWDYASLPANGYTVALRNGTWTSNPSWFRGLVFEPFTGFPTGLGALVDPVIEYYNPFLDHYFITSSQPDIDALGSLGGPWKPTGESFPAWIARQDTSLAFASPPKLAPVCRLYLVAGNSSSHFFSVSADECNDAQAKHPDYIKETSAAFLASLPDPVTGECSHNQIPVYRLWNARADSNHRYTTSPAIRDDMVSRGYVKEGYGPEAVAMCVGGGIPAE